jgi:hypothetical protein
MKTSAEIWRGLACYQIAREMRHDRNQRFRRRTLRQIVREWREYQDQPILRTNQ